MARYTKKLRQQIIEDFARQNNGWYDPSSFVAHVRSAGPEHPAYEWFEWDDTSAAESYRVDQAREFASGLRIRFEVEEVRRGKVKVVERTAPLLTSPEDRRRDGGGYYFTDPNDPAHVRDLCSQAARDIRWMLERHGFALAHVGADTVRLGDALSKLEAVTVDQAEAA